jgi:hypothetical protein
MTRTYHIDGTLPEDGWVFVFGSNDKGFHSLGAALVAVRQYGAKRYVGEGHVGNSYALPTRWWSHTFKSVFTLPIEIVEENIARFCQFTIDHPELKFFVTSVGCGHAGLDYEKIAPLFKSAINCSFPENWDTLLEE